MNKLLFLRELVKGEKVDMHLFEMSKAEKLNRGQLATMQFNKLTILIDYLERHNPFFLSKLNRIPIKNNENTTKLKCLLSEFPIIDKNYIKERFEVWLSDEFNSKKPPLIYTSGSTGTPFKFFQSTENRDAKTAAKARLLKWHGVERGEKQYCYMGISTTNTMLIKIKVFLNNRFIWKRLDIDSTLMDYDHEIDRINRGKPITIYGYPSSIYELARYSLEKNKPIKDPKLKMVIFSGESHTTYIKEVVEKAFGIRPVDEYCSNEGYIAGTCEYDNLHLFEDILIAEVQDSNGKINETGKGELIVTHLHTNEFPFLRYKTGDIVEILDNKCKCGRPFKIIKSVDGRKGTYIINGNQKISDAALNVYITKTGYIEKIHRYQIIQSKQSEVIVKVVPVSELINFSDFETKIRALFDQIVVHFEYVNYIPKESSGKYRVLINNI